MGFNWTDGYQWTPHVHAVSICLWREIHVWYVAENVRDISIDMIFFIFFIFYCYGVALCDSLFSVYRSPPEDIKGGCKTNKQVHCSTQNQVVIVITET